jgi:hypothetical protein
MTTLLYIFLKGCKQLCYEESCLHVVLTFLMDAEIPIKMSHEM